jgi:tetratricopeptide (TPR) repeat protein
MLKRISPGILLLLASLLITVMLGEGSFRVLLWAQNGFSTDPVYKELKQKSRAAGVSSETFNIYYFGGSSMQGEPYPPSLSIPALVSYLFDGKLLDKPIRSVNLAGSGRDIEYNLIRMQTIAEHPTAFHPSLFVVYSGHNEFLKYERPYSSPPVVTLARYSKLVEFMMRALDRYDLTIDDRRLFDEPLMNDAQFNSVLDAYGGTVTSMVEAAKSIDIPILLSTVAGNYADWQPNRSSSCRREEDHPELIRLMEAATEAERAEDLRLAAQYYAKAVDLCPGFAEAIFRQARLYRRLGQNDEAWKLFQKAVDSDGMPLRASSRQNDFIRGLPANSHLILIDVVQGLRAQTPDGLIGDNLMIDGHHPNLSGYLEIAKMFARGVHDHFGVTGNLREPTAAEVAEQLGFDGSAQLAVLVSRGRWMTRMATWRYDPAERFARARDNFMKASRIDPDSYKPDLGLAIIAFLQKDPAQAEAHLARARQKDKREVDKYLKISWIRRVLARAYQR